MTYQLVLQFDASSAGDFDRLVEFEEKLDDIENELAEVDGHDFGSGEFNVFLLTHDPDAAFRKVSLIAKLEGLQDAMRAAYREINAEKYVVLWPPDLQRFDVL